MTRADRRRTSANALGVIALTAIVLLTLGPEHPRPIPPFWCVWCGRHDLLDTTLNVLLFMPLGAALRLGGATRRRIALFAFALSTAIEAVQFQIPGREPSARDIAANTAGALLGALLLARLGERRNGMFLPFGEPGHRPAKSFVQ